MGFEFIDLYMKLNYTTATVLLFIPFFSAIAQDSEYIDLYCTKDFKIEGLWANSPYFNSNVIWQTSDGVVTKPGANNNLWVTIDTTIETGLISGYSNTPIAIHDLNYNLSLSSYYTIDDEGNKQYSTSRINIIGPANTDLHITGDFNATLERADLYWNPATFEIVLGGDMMGGDATNYKGNTYHIFGDMNITNKSSYTSLYNQGMSLNITNGSVLKETSKNVWHTTRLQQNCTFQVDGDLNFMQTPGYTSADDLNSQRIILNTGVTNFIVNGVVNFDTTYKSTVNYECLSEWDINYKLGNKADTFDPSEAFDTNITIGGLNGIATLRMTETYNASEHKTTMTFTNKSDAVWQGVFRNTGGEQFHIKMDKSATHSQTMIFSDKSQTSSATGYLVDSVTVSGGTLYFQNQSSSGNGTLIVDGGKFGALGDGAMFANAVLSSGDILIANADSFAAGIYTLSLGELSREGSEKIGIDFNGFDASMLIGEPAYTLILADSLAGFDESDANSDFIAKNLLGALADFAWDGNMLTVSFTQVPEPTAIAAVFGLFAFLFAARRRRK